jgi:hypothetical protein
MDKQILKSDIKTLFLEERFKVDEMMSMFDYNGLDLLSDVGIELYNTLGKQLGIVTSDNVKEIISFDRQIVLANLVILGKAKRFIKDGFNFNLN